MNSPKLREQPEVTASKQNRRKRTQSHSKGREAMKRQVAGLKEAGLSNIEIGKTVGLHRDTIAAYLNERAEEQQTLDRFKDVLGDCLNADLMFSTILKAKLLKNLGTEDLATLSLSDKRQLIRDLTVSMGIVFDKLRLHEVKSTVNASHRIVRGEAYQAIDWAATSQIVSGSEDI